MDLTMPGGERRPFSFLKASLRESVLETALCAATVLFFCLVLRQSLRPPAGLELAV